MNVDVLYAVLYTDVHLCGSLIPHWILSLMHGLTSAVREGGKEAAALLKFQMAYKLNVHVYIQSVSEYNSKGSNLYEAANSLLSV